jgi:hypothetical protein
MEVHTEIAAGSAVKRSPKARLLTVGHLDGRTRAAKRACAIAAELELGFGGKITAVQKATIGRAAVLCALAEDLGARRLAGQPIPFDYLLRAEGCAKRAIRAVLAECSAQPAVSRGWLARARWAERAKQAKRAKAAAIEPNQTLTASDDDRASDE